MRLESNGAQVVQNTHVRNCRICHISYIGASIWACTVTRVSVEGSRCWEGNLGLRALISTGAK